MKTSQEYSKKLGRKMLVTPIEFPNEVLAVGTDLEVLGELPQVNFFNAEATKIPEISTVKGAGEIMQKVLQAIGGGSEK